MTTTDTFAEITRIWWERFAALEDWVSAVKIAQVTTARRPNVWRGWEDLAWALHKKGDTFQAYKILAPRLRKLSIPGPPSGRAAYSLACFCGALGRVKEGTRWLRLAHNLCQHDEGFRIQALIEPDLRLIWPGVAQLSVDAYSVLE